MATVVNSVVERHQGLGGGDDTTSRSTTRVFLVELTTLGTDLVTTILADEDIPQPNDQHPDDSGIRVRNRSVDLVNDDDHLHWEVTVEYSNRAQGGGGGSDPDPWDLPAEVSFGSAQYTRVLDKCYRMDTTVAAVVSALDDTGVPDIKVLNSAGYAFDPPATQEEENMTVTVKRNEEDTDFDPDDLSLFRNSINKTAITIGGVDFDPAQGRMRSIVASPAYSKDGDLYWQVTYTIEKKTDTHIRQILDAGFYHYDADINTTLRIMDSGDGDGGKPQPVTEPKPLDGVGGIGDPDSPIYLAHQTYLAKEWSTLDLPEDQDGVS